VSGWFAMKRGSLSHPLFAPKGPFSRFEAWVWMVENAAWKDMTVTRGNKSIAVPRGNLHHSIRFMAGKFRWSEKAVRNFIDALVAAGTVEKVGAHLGAHLGAQLRLCNYDKYQFEGHTWGHTQGHKEEQITIPSKEGAPSAPSIWDAGLAVLTRRGVPEKQARSALGRWKKHHGEETVLWATRQIERADAAEPISYGEKILSKKQPEREGFVAFGAFGDGEVVR